MSNHLNTTKNIFDALVKHQIYLMRYSSGVEKAVDKLLSDTERDIISRIMYELSKAGNGGFDPDRLELLMTYIRMIREEVWNKILEDWEIEFKKLAELQSQFTIDTLNRNIPVEVQIAIPHPTLIKKLAVSQPFEGKILSDWAKDISARDLDRISRQITVGMVQGETIQQITSRVRSVFKITTRNARSIARTATAHIASRTSQEIYKANSDIVKNEIFMATLDSRTTITCASKDGNIYPLGVGPIPPLHFNCRSIRTPLINSRVIGDRPFNPTAEKLLKKEYKEATGKDPDEYGQKTKFKRWADKKTRERIGRVPARTTYSEWLRKQSREFVESVLGKGKAKLFLDKKLELSKFITRSGKELTLAELEKRIL